MAKSSWLELRWADRRRRLAGEQPEQGWAEQHAGAHLADHGQLAEAAGHLRHQPARQQDHDGGEDERRAQSRGVIVPSLIGHGDGRPGAARRSEVVPA
ncbi:MAG: hypothetical protein HOV79_04670 [Hamadaea sp.]|nr:hypothetical protein [Hamadaea sp.]